MNNSRSDIENWWAVEATIASYNHVYQVTYKTNHKVQGPIGISIYEGAPIASFHYEFLALSMNAKAVMGEVLAYDIPNDKQYVIDVFHPLPSSPALKKQYTQFAHEFVRTGPVLGLHLSANTNVVLPNIHLATTIQQAEIANYHLTAEGERIHVQTLRDPHIHTFYIQIDGEAAGWLQLATIYPNVRYSSQLYVLDAFLNCKLGTTLVQHAQAYAVETGLKFMTLIPSNMSIPLYRRLGYRPLLYFSAFRPSVGLS